MRSQSRPIWNERFFNLTLQSRQCKGTLLCFLILYDRRKQDLFYFWSVIEPSQVCLRLFSYNLLWERENFLLFLMGLELRPLTRQVWIHHPNASHSPFTLDLPWASTTWLWILQNKDRETWNHLNIFNDHEDQLFFSY